MLPTASKSNHLFLSLFEAHGCTISEDVVDEYRRVAVLKSDSAILTIQQDPTIVLDTGRSGYTYAVVFHPDGIHLLSGGSHGIHRWLLADGQEVGKQAGMIVASICVSRDHKWIVCGAVQGASVWDAELREKVIDVERKNTVCAVDVSSDSTRFATGTAKEASIWSISSGERLVGTLRQDGGITGIKFSPNGEHIATACFTSGSIRVFDTHNGDKLITIESNITHQSILSTLLAWSNDGKQFFSANKDNKAGSFQVSTGPQLAESQILSDDDENIGSIALSTNGKFLAAYAGHTISFLDTQHCLRSTQSSGTVKQLDQLPFPRIVAILQMVEMTGKSMCVT